MDVGEQPTPPSSHWAARDPREYLRILWRWRWLILAFVILLPLAVFVVERGRQKVYQSSVLVNIQSEIGATALLTGTSPDTAPTSQTLAAAARVITTPAVARTAATYLHPRPADPDALLNDVAASADPNTGFITITANAPLPQRAADVANSFAKAVSTRTVASSNQALSLSIAQLQSQLAALGPKDPGRAQLSDQLQRFRALRAAQTPSPVQVVQAAAPSATPISPRVTRSTALALIVGLLLALGAVVLAESMDRRIRDPEELERLTGLPLLSAIPASAFSGELDFFTHEAFYTLRASLTYYNVDKPLSSVLVTSASKDDGKTLVATQLAIALARTGKDVIVLDTDLRRSTAALRLGLGRPPQGLSDVLIGQLSLADALLDVDAGEETPGRLRLLPAGHAPPNPSELVGSQRMRDLITELSQMADITIIDTAPLLTVSDSLPMLKLVSGTVLVARIRSSSRHAVVRVRNVVATAGGTALGVVATGAAADGVYSGYHYGYAEASSNGSAKGRGVFRRARS